jgi:signal transduction histidine kinase
MLRTKSIYSNPTIPILLLVLLFTYTSLTSFSQKPVGQTWETISKADTGTIVIYCYESRPFVFRSDDGKLHGIEYEIIEGLKAYLKESRQINLDIIWKEAASFNEVYTLIAKNKEEGVFGASAFSITAKRQQEVGFTPSFMADISVIVSSENVPIVKNAEEFNHVFSNLSAITILGTTHEQDILKLKSAGNLSFPIKYIPSSQNILEEIEKSKDSFGFIDLPIYINLFKINPSVKVKRQNLFPKKREGHAIIYPQGSDWAEPIHEYFTSKDFNVRLEKIITQYIDIDLYHFVESLAGHSNDQVALLTKEKELQSQDLIGKSKQIEENTRIRNLIIALLLVTSVSLGSIIILYRKRNQQNKRIESQGRNIESQNKELENRNNELIALNDEKNHLIKILAHDLRTPINHVQGLAQLFLLSNRNLENDQKLIIENIAESSVRLNKMITNILDVDSIENGRSKVFMDAVNISSVIQQVVKSFEKQAAKKEIKLIFQTSNYSSLIQADSLFLIQIFENLISNAIKFSESGKKVEVQISEQKTKVRIEVKDEGPGVTEEDLSVVFKKFQQLSAKPTAGEGSIGIGLSIVKRYVEQMDGTVRCESEVDRGANFIVEFNKA